MGSGGGLKLGKKRGGPSPNNPPVGGDRSGLSEVEGSPSFEHSSDAP